MHEVSSFHILAQCDNGYIGVCECCHEFNFVYKNILLAFTEDELIRFCGWIMAYRFHSDTYLPLLHGKTRVYRSPLNNLFMAFHENELDEVGELFTQVQLILEARDLVKNDRKEP